MIDEHVKYFDYSSLIKTFKGRIYQIVSCNYDKVYVGSTRLSLHTRLNQHIKDFKRYQKDKYNFVTSFLILAKQDYRIELLEEFDCSSKQELLEKENQYIQKIDCVNMKDLSKNCPVEDYNLDIEKINEEFKIKREQFMRRFIKYSVNRKITCDCGKILKIKSLYLHFRSVRHKEYMAKKVKF